MLDFEKLALETRKEAKEMAEFELDDRKEEFKDISKREHELFFDLWDNHYVQQAMMFSNYVTKITNHMTKMKTTNRDFFRLYL